MDFASDVEWGLITGSFYLRYDLFILLFLALVFTMVRRVERSWMGLAMDAVRLDETASACFGINIVRWKVTAFTMGNVLMGMAGAVYAMMLGYISPANFTFSDSLLFLSILLLGGMGKLLGRHSGDLHHGGSAGKTSVHSGIPLSAVFPAGSAHDRVPPHGSAAPQNARCYFGGCGMSLLSCTGLTMRFGGLAALNKLDVQVEEGDVIGLVGPNGSGKTTFFNVLTGIYTPSEGHIVFDGKDITSKTPQEICRAGIARTFQRSRLCLELTVFDNVMMGNCKNLNMSFWHNVIRRRAFFQECRDDEEHMRLMLKALNPTLADKIRKPVGELSMIDRRRVEICRALTGRPRLLLLDEPSAGMTQDETRAAHGRACGHGI